MQTKNYEVIKAKFIDFLAEPQQELSQQKFADKEGVNPATLSEWKADPELQDKLRKRIDKLLGDDLPKIYKLIKRKALGGEYKFVELYLRQSGVLKDVKDVKLSAGLDVIQLISNIPRPK